MFFCDCFEKFSLNLPESVDSVSRIIAVNSINSKPLFSGVLEHYLFDSFYQLLVTDQVL